jgi:phosphatidylinositol glycan class V
LASTALAHVSHLAAVLTLYFFVARILPTSLQRKRQVAFTAACLHVISPAGIFLSAPYAESSYAFLTFAGCYAYAAALSCRQGNGSGDQYKDILWTSAAGMSFGYSALMRGNGLLNGIPFALDALISVYTIWTTRKHTEVARLLGIGTGGTLIGLGFILPQVVAWADYCYPTASRPWCMHRLPSIYSWVQTYYWDVGFMQYWTLSNLPLFLLATPMLLLLFDTGYSCLHHSRAILLALNGEEKPSQRNSAQYQTEVKVFVQLIERFALPQLVLATLAMFNFHVQIVNRISSGYPLWYLVLAIAIHDASPVLGCGHRAGAHYQPFKLLSDKRKEWIVRAMVGYAIVQAGLFASFLPPA